MYFTVYICSFFLFRKSEIEKYFDENKHLRFIPSKQKHDKEDLINDILEILNPVYNDYLKVFQLEGEDSLTDTIFRSVLQSNQ